jgi:hypothetical protein
MESSRTVGELCACRDRVADCCVDALGSDRGALVAKGFDGGVGLAFRGAGEVFELQPAADFVDLVGLQQECADQGAFDGALEAHHDRLRRMDSSARVRRCWASSRKAVVSADRTWRHWLPFCHQ